MRFSTPVAVTGVPALKLETGTIDREALWINTTNTNASTADDDAVAVEVESDDCLLLFEYTVITGDSADDLDYWSDEEVISGRNIVPLFYMSGRPRGKILPRCWDIENQKEKIENHLNEKNVTPLVKEADIAKLLLDFVHSQHSILVFGLFFS